MFEMEGPLTQFDDFMLHYDIDTSSGQSGAGLWIMKNGIVNTFGIHTLGNSLSNQNSGIRIKMCLNF